VQSFIALEVTMLQSGPDQVGMGTVVVGVIEIIGWSGMLICQPIGIEVPGKG